MTVAAPPFADDRLARKNVVILGVAQALFNMTLSSQILYGGLVGAMLAPEGYRHFATLPISFMVLGNMLTVIPAALFMRRYGRRAGFMLGAAAAVLAMIVASLGIWNASFVVFCIASLMLGIFQGFGGYYRFAAADTASEAFRPKAISWVLAGGVVAAIAGPTLASRTADLFEPVMYLGTYVALIFVAGAAIFVASLVDIPVLDHRTQSKPGRPLGVIMRQPVFIVAVISGLVAYGLMNFLMTATPLAMQGCGFDTTSEVPFVISSHVLAMFGPSFVTGSIIARFGVLPVIAAGMVILVGCSVVTLAGVGLENFWLGLVLLGIGWNFGYVGGTTLLTQSYRPEERAKTQAANDFIVFGSVAVASFSSGYTFTVFGWTTVAAMMLPFLALALGAVGWLFMRQRAAA